jgi:hypothetical protein
MATETILCSQCEQKKQQLEASGRLNVIRCSPLPEDEGKPPAQQRCEIEWVIKPLTGGTH